MSVPASRMAPVTPTGDPDRIMGLKKPVFWGIIAVGLVLAWYIYRRSQNNSSSALTSADAGAQPDTTNGVTAADIGGTPADNSFATNTDLSAIEQQIQQLQDSMFQLQQSNGGNGAGFPVPKSPSPGGGITGQPPSFPFPGSGGGFGSGGPPTKSPVIVPTGSSVPLTTTPQTSSSAGYPAIPGGQGSVKVAGGRLTQ